MITEADPLHPTEEKIVVYGEGSHKGGYGINLLTHMAIEFTKSDCFDKLDENIKATICQEDAPHMEIENLMDGGKDRHPTYGEPYVEWFLRGKAKYAILQAKELIKQLNEVES